MSQESSAKAGGQKGELHRHSYTCDHPAEANPENPRNDTRPSQSAPAGVPERDGAGGPVGVISPRGAFAADPIAAGMLSSRR
jgi:hypothetical protein